MSDSAAPPTALRETTRRLAAILHADVVGYSRLMGADEAGTHARLIAHREILAERIRRADGRIVGSAGDAILAEFPSVAGALSAALATQRELAGRNEALPHDTRLAFRIGINLGEVIVDAGDLFGNGVNVAARVQALAPAGGVAVSGVVRDQLRSDARFGFRDLGAHRVKNIAEPIRIFAVDGAAGATGSARRRPASGTLAATLVVVAAIAIGLLALPRDWAVPRALHAWTTRPGDDEPVPARKSVERPTIAVLPLESRSGDPDQAYFTAGLTEDVIGDLGRFDGLTVLSWNAVAAYADRPVGADVLRRELGARYVVTGSVRRDADRLRASIQLTDTADGALLWSDRYDRSMQDVFGVQDDIARRIVGALAIHVSEAERSRAEAKPTDDLAAYDHVLQGRAQLRRIERSANDGAREHFEAALALDPGYAAAHVGLGFTHLHDFKYGWTQWLERAIEEAQRRAEEAIRLDETNDGAHALLAQVLTVQQRYDRAELAIGRAIELNPNSAMSLGVLGMVLVRSGRAEDAVEPLERALRIDPYPVVWWLVSLSQAYYFLGRYEEAASVAERYGRPHEEDPVLHVMLAAAYAQLGADEKAAQAMVDLRRISPFFDARVFALGFADESHRQALLEGLEAAGL